MPRGGARNRSGPSFDPNSGRSETRGVVLTALPAQFSGEAPSFPLPPRTVYRWEFEDKRRFQVPDSEATDAVAEREVELWEWAWRTPQACAWAMVSESWRLPMIAMWVRTFVVCESSDATAADKGALHRFADQIGLTPAGLKENGWAIAADEVAAKAAARSEEPAAPAARRLRAASSDGDG